MTCTDCKASPTKLCATHAATDNLTETPDPELLLKAAATVLRRLQVGGCWCEVGIGNPNMRGGHPQACLDASALLADLEGR